MAKKKPKPNSKNEFLKPFRKDAEKKHKENPDKHYPPDVATQRFSASLDKLVNSSVVRKFDAKD